MMLENKFSRNLRARANTPCMAGGFILSLIYYMKSRESQIHATFIFDKHGSMFWHLHPNVLFFFGSLLIQLSMWKRKKNVGAGSTGFRCCRAHFRVHIFSGANLTWKSRDRKNSMPVNLHKEFSIFIPMGYVCDPLTMCVDLGLLGCSDTCMTMWYAAHTILFRIYTYWLNRTHTDMHA